MGERGEREGYWDISHRVEKDGVRIIIREIMRVVISIIPWNNCSY